MAVSTVSDLVAGLQRSRDWLQYTHQQTIARHVPACDVRCQAVSRRPCEVLASEKLLGELECKLSAVTGDKVWAHNQIKKLAVRFTVGKMGRL